MPTLGMKDYHEGARIGCCLQHHSRFSSSPSGPPLSLSSLSPCISSRRNSSLFPLRLHSVSEYCCRTPSCLAQVYQSVISHAINLRYPYTPSHCTSEVPRMFARFSCVLNVPYLFMLFRRLAAAHSWPSVECCSLFLKGDITLIVLSFHFLNHHSRSLFRSWPFVSP